MSDLIDIKYLFTGLILLILGGVGRHLYIQRKERRQRNLPVLEKLRKLLDEVEKLDYLDKGVTNVLSQNTIMCDGDKLLNNVNDCGGPFGCGEIQDARQKIEDFLKNGFPLYDNLNNLKKELGAIKNSLQNFITCLTDFNKRWPHTTPIKQLEKKNGARLIEEASRIEEKADSLKTQIDKLKREADKKMEPRWF
jgi:hypothetical protein